MGMADDDFAKKLYRDVEERRARELRDAVVAPKPVGKTRKVRDVRKVTVLAYRNGEVLYPRITLNGPWLSRAGFEPGTQVVVQLRGGQIVLSKEGQ